MKRYILKIILFFAIVVVTDIGVGMLGDYLQTHARKGFAKHTNDLVMKDYHDVVILGSSRAHHHYDTPFLSDTLGLDVYNAGYDGNGVVLAYGLLSMMLERYSPKLVVFDVEPAFDIYIYDSDNGHKRYLKYLKPYYKNDIISDIIRDVSEEEWYKVHSGLIRYNSIFISMISDNLRSSQDDNDGYLPLTGKYELIAKEKDENTELVVDSLKLKYVDKIIMLAQSKKVPIMIIFSPKFGVKSSESLNPIKDICKIHEVPCMDYYCDDYFMEHSELFREPMHLNSDGARLFSSQISTVIREYIDKFVY